MIRTCDGCFCDVPEPHLIKNEYVRVTFTFTAAASFIMSLFMTAISFYVYRDDTKSVNFYINIFHLGVSVLFILCHSSRALLISVGASMIFFVWVCIVGMYHEYYFDRELSLFAFGLFIVFNVFYSILFVNFRKIKCCERGEVHSVV